jgi:peroxiredoxin Q/BCP
MGLPAGSTMPEFSLKDQDGNWFHSGEHLGKKPLVIFFYPKDFTPGCTAEACLFRDHYEEFTDAGALVIGISSDSQVSHQSFARKHRLPYVLLSDPKKEVRRKFWVENRLLNPRA